MSPTRHFTLVANWDGPKLSRSLYAVAIVANCLQPSEIF